jgi:hypothetical protein
MMPKPQRLSKSVHRRGALTGHRVDTETMLDSEVVRARPRRDTGTPVFCGVTVTGTRRAPRPP